MISTEKYLFDKQKMFETCCAYYQMRGYSREHCEGYIGAMEDYELVIAYNEICKEKEEAEANGYHLF